jgi:hypothetical protein
MNECTYNEDVISQRKTSKQEQENYLTAPNECFGADFDVRRPENPIQQRQCLRCPACLGFPRSHGCNIATISAINCCISNVITKAQSEQSSNRKFQ